MAKKLLIGVPHSTDEEINVLESYIRRRNVSKVGLELCSDYEEKMRLGADGYSYQLAGRLEKLGIEVIPLDDRKYVDGALTLGYFLRLCAKDPESEKIKEKIDAFYWQRDHALHVRRIKESHFESQYWNTFLSGLYALLEEYTTPADIAIRFRDVQYNRESFMLERILDTSPEIVVLGSCHIDYLEDCLYQYSSTRLFRGFILPVSLYMAGRNLGLIPDVNPIPSHLR